MDKDRERKNDFKEEQLLGRQNHCKHSKGEIREKKCEMYLWRVEQRGNREDRNSG